MRFTQCVPSSKDKKEFQEKVSAGGDKVEKGRLEAVMYHFFLGD